MQLQRMNVHANNKAKLNRQQLCTRRILMISIAQLILVAILIIRLGFLQFVRYDDYRLRSDKNRIKSIVVPPVRGTIFDRNGIPLTENKSNYRVVIYNSKHKIDYEKVIGTLTDILDLSTAQKKAILKKIQQNRRHSIVSLIDKLSWEDLAKIEVNSYKLEGISVEKGQIRYYPFAEATANLIGYVATPTETEINRSSSKKELMMHPDFRIGKNGLEKSYEQYLKGQFGLKYLEVNAYGTPIRELNFNGGEHGKDLHLTIDIELQKYAYERIKKYAASVVVMDVKTGEILAMVSAPSFDPNDFVWGISSAKWYSLLHHPKSPLTNKPTSAIYPPASTIKLVASLTALQDQIITPETIVNCKGFVTLGKRRFHCWKKSGHGKMDIYNAIATSCGSYFFTLAKHLDVDSFHEMALKFGLNNTFNNLNFPDIKAGVVPSTKWKRKHIHEPWVTGDMLNTVTGQGFLAVTPLQLAVMVTRIANGGYPVQPILDRASLSLNADIFQQKPLVPPEHITIVKEGMYRVVNQKNGTAYWARIKDEHYRMAGKTGTAQVISKREDEYDSISDIPEHLRNHGLFVAFTPFDKPRFAIAVVVENGISGTVTAAPIARDILLEARRLFSNQ